MKITRISIGNISEWYFGIETEDVYNMIEKALPEAWKALQSMKKEYNGLSEYFTTRDLEPRNASIKAGRMHIRYGTEKMVSMEAYGGMADGKVSAISYGSVNVHFDRVDVTLFPITHLIVDSFYQGVIWNVK